MSKGIDVIRCGCGETFDTINELVTHAREVHGVPVTD